MREVFLIDGTAFCYRAFYAVRALSTSDGRPTNAVYGFAIMLQALRERRRPPYLAVAFDVGKPTYRHRQFAAYKAQRKPMPEALIQQLPLIKRLLQTYRIPVFEQEGYEAEDVLATIAEQVADDETEVFLVTEDKDALQLVNAHIKVYNPHKADTVLDAAAVQARYGVRPEQMVDLMALMGDQIDNIPGVPGIGEKTASELLQRFGTLERLYAHLDEVTPEARRKSLEAAHQQVELARELARINRRAPLRVTLDGLRVQEPDWRGLRAVFRELEFKRLLQALETEAPAPLTSSVTTHVLADAREIDGWLRRVAQRGAQPSAVLGWPGRWGETVSAGRLLETVLVSVAAGPEEAWVFELSLASLGSPHGQRFAAWLGNTGSPKVSHDAKTTMRLLGELGVILKGLSGDTMLAAYLLNPARTTQRLSDLADEHLGQPLVALPRAGAAAGLPSEDGVSGRPLDREALKPFGAYAAAVLPLHERLLADLQAAQLLTLYTDLELPLVDVLVHMEAHGVAVDLDHLAGLRASMDADLARLTQEIYRLAGCVFNLNSPKQLARVLFERLQLPIVKRTKTGPSTDSEVLRQLAARHPLPDRLTQYRELSKLVSTYVDALPALVAPRTRRIHTSFNQTATATGRLSSSEPNLQNIPIKTELGRSIRRAFVPGAPDGVLVAADYSQIELRILAHLSRDERLIEAFSHGADIHRLTASLIYGIPEPEVRPEQRNAMKAINYGILYGMSAHGLSKELSTGIEESQAFIDAYFDRYPKVRAYLDAQIAGAKRDGFVQTLLGRRRYIPEVGSPDPAVRQFGERMAVNAPIQGTAADLIKRAMIQMAPALREERLESRMVLQVHDELVFESPRRELPPLVALVRRVMEGAITLRVPLVVTVKAGPNWLDLTPV